MLRRTIMPVKRLLPIIKRTINNKTNVDDLIRANSFIQHTKDDIIQEVKTILKKELKKEMADDTAITNHMIFISFIVTNLNILISLVYC